MSKPSAACVTARSVWIIPLLILSCTQLPCRAQTPVTNQYVYDVTPYLKEHHATLLQRFEEEPVVTGRVMFLGNSITEGGPWRKLLRDSTVINRGIGGDITFGVLDRLDDVVRRLPSKLFIMIGINDIAKDIPDEVIADNYRKIIERVRVESPGTEIFVQSILPVNPDHPGFPQHYDKEDHVVHTNRLIRHVADTAGCRYVNLFPVLMDARERLDERYTVDGVHLNQAGYKLWVGYLRENGYLP